MKFISLLASFLERIHAVLMRFSFIFKTDVDFKLEIPPDHEDYSITALCFSLVYAASGAAMFIL